MDQSIRFRLGKMLGLLGSDQDGEVLAAARAIKRLLESQKLGFGDLVNMVCNPEVVDPPAAGRGRARAPVLRHNAEIVAMAETILENGIMLRPHERGFVEDIRVRAGMYANFRMTPKQFNWFNYLFARFGA